MIIPIIVVAYNNIVSVIIAVITVSINVNK